MRKQFDKLIRDRIPEIIQKSGAQCEVTILESENFRRELLRKLVEEAEEARKAGHGDSPLTELADLEEVISALLELEDRGRSELLDRQSSRLEERGGFAKRLFLRWTEE